jgi:hypothetical protein
MTASAANGVHFAGKLRGTPIAIDYDRTPFLVIWETTQACDLACRHCRASAQPEAHPSELTTAEGERVIEQVRDLGTPIPSSAAISSTWSSTARASGCAWPRSRPPPRCSPNRSSIG